ncbi:hypothetical protein [Alkalitalea saponilacus]|uniref:Uncharacterized protein n=1 Tax=Alkalitalea saponilacus TaxID=889453 RepID=A0A1T5F8B1_9BACT|nr:hypothetical protein [Alkalitalea saponilacus]ASB50139.1 hypothetical protein CDL62_13820 [Alkalitalea saponilacus]SKB92395.1 hypothetical protein SAMN03080601_01517 [Alkalitalea saponilacus]
MIKYRINWMILCCMFGLLLYGCKQDDIYVNLDNSDDNREVGLAGPFAKIGFNLADFLDDIDEDILHIGEDGLISLKYREEVYIDWKELVKLNDVDANWDYFSLRSTSLKSANSIEFSQKVQMNHRGDVRYDSLTLNQGILNMYVVFPTDESGQIDISIPEVQDENGDGLTFSHIVTPESNHFSVSDYSLANHEIHFNQDPDMVPGEEFSYINVITSFTPDNPNAEIENIDLSFSLTGMQPEITFGYFGVQESEELNASLTFDAFEELDLIDEIEFGDFILNVEVENSIGVPFFVTANNVRFYKEEETDPDQYDWLLNLFNGDELTMQVNPAVYGPPVQPRISTLSPYINKANSNIIEIGNGYPVKMLCDLFATSNPDDDGKQNFMGIIDQLRADLIIEIPMWFRTEKYARKDTIEFDFLDIIGDDEEEVRRMKEVNLYFDFTSWLPLNASVEAWVVDIDGNRISTLIPPSTVIPAAMVNEELRVLNSVKESFKISVNRDQINKFIDEKAMEIILETTLATPENGSVFIKLFEDARLETVFNFDLEGQIP